MIVAVVKSFIVMNVVLSIYSYYSIWKGSYGMLFLVIIFTTLSNCFIKYNHICVA
jgi:hypothetical protein